MPDLSTTVDLIFRGVDNAAGTIDTVNRNINAFAGQVESATAPLANLTKTVLAAETAAAALAIAYGVTAYNASVQFESAVADLAKVFQGTDAELEAFTGQVKSLASEYRVSAIDAVSASADWLKAGKDTGEALELVRLSIENAIAAEQTQAESTRSLKQLTETYGLSVEELRTKLDFLNTVSDNNAVTSKQLLDALQGSAAAAKTAGLSFEELVAFLTPAVAATQEGAEVGRAFRTVLANLVDPTNQQVQALQSLGVALVDSNGNATTAGDRFQQLLTVLQDTDETTRATTLAVIGGADQFARLSAAAEGAGTAQSILNGEFRTTITVADEANRILGTSEALIGGLRNAITGLNREVGDELNPALDGIVQALTELFAGVAEAVDSGALDGLFVGLADRFAFIQENIETLAANLPAAIEGLDFDRLLDSLDSVGSAIADLFNVDISDPESIRQALQVIVDGLAALNEFSAGAIEGLKPLIDGIVSFGQSVIDSGPEVLELAGNIGGFATTLNTLAPIIGSVSTAIAGLLGAKALGGAILLLKDVVSAFTLAGSGALTLGSAIAGPLGLAAGIAFLVDQIVKLTGLGGGLNDVLNPDWLGGEGATLTGAVGDLFESLGELIGIGGDTEASFDGVNDSAQQAIRAMMDYSAATDLAALAAQSAAQKQRDLDAAFESQKLTAEDLTAINDRLTESFADSGFVYDATTGEVIKVASSYEELTGTTYSLVEANDTAAGRVLTLDERLREAAASGDVAKDKILELETRLREAELDAQVTLDVAQLEADTEIFKAQIQSLTELAEIQATIEITNLEQAGENFRAFLSSIDNTISTTGGTINELIQAIGDVDATTLEGQNKLGIYTSVLDQQILLQQEAVDVQNRLAEEQINYLQAQTDRLRSGQALIEINGAGLEPELEAFMFKILQNIQTRANADAQAFLLGI